MVSNAKQRFHKFNQQLVIDKYLPHNFLAEKMILSCLLINYEAIETTLQILPFHAFYFKNHQEIYKAISEMYKTQTKVDALTLVSFLQENGTLEKIGGVKVVIELITQVPNLIYLDDYIRLVKDKFIRRSLIKLGYEAINSGYITNVPLENILNDFEIKLFNLTNEITPSTLFSSAEVLNDIFLKLKEKLANPGLSGLSSGFYDLDCLIQGFQQSDLIIIAGRPSMGKTALSLNLGLNVIKNDNLPVLFFSLEMSKEQIMYRVLAMETNINQIRLKSGRLSDDDWLKLTKIIKMVAKFPFFVDDTSSLSIQDIRSRLKTILFEQNKIGLVIIDYLQLMQNPKGKMENRVQELSQITRQLKNLAREFNVPVIALSQLSRNVENRIDKKPILSDLRESGSIEQDADLILMLSQNHNLMPPSGTNQNDDFQLLELIIAKQRNGPLGTIKLKFDSKHNKFYDFELEEIE
jgi:replicative DNA helicase